jgi:preprotein translocase subunit SecD
MLLAFAGATFAQDKTQVSVHRTCIADGSGEKLSLRYWYPDVNNSLPEPVCVFKTPEFGGVPFRSAKVTYDSGRATANIVVEFDESARSLIEKMTARNLGNVVAIVVGDRIASMPMIWKAYSDNKLLIVVRNKNEAARIVNVLNGGAAGD